jgi:hypothetical protein
MTNSGIWGASGISYGPKVCGRFYSAVSHPPKSKCSRIGTVFVSRERWRRHTALHFMQLRGFESLASRRDIADRSAPDSATRLLAFHAAWSLGLVISTGTDHRDSGDLWSGD